MFLEIYKDTKELGDAEARRIAALLKKKPTHCSVSPRAVGNLRL